MPSSTPGTIVGRRMPYFPWGQRTYIMGVINVTPDSFSGDGLGADPRRALEQALRFQDEGADLIDVGGESTRPGHTPISADEELSRVIPVLEHLASELRVPVSIDTYKSRVAREAVQAGARIINDIWGLKRGPGIAHVAAEHRTGLILMHNQEGTAYQNLISDIRASLQGSVNRALGVGVPREHLILDPGIGFGKTAAHNLEVLRRLAELRSLGLPLLVGASRKSSIGLVLDLAVDQRVEGTAASVAIAIAHGVDMVRVHDVREMVRVARMSDAIVRGWDET